MVGVIVEGDGRACTRVWYRANMHTDVHVCGHQGRSGADETDAGTSVRWCRTVPEALRALDTFESYDYADVVTAAAGEMGDTSVEADVRRLLRDVPAPLRVLVPVAQRLLLGLRLELRPSADHLLGWRIADRGEGWVRLEASSWFLSGHVIFYAEDDRLSLASFVRYDRRIAALIWPPVSLIHRQVALAMMRSAAAAGQSARGKRGTKR